EAETKTLPIHIVGIGTAGPVALHVAAIDDRIREITLELSLVSWSAVVRTPISYNQLTNGVPGALAVYDLPDLAARLAPRALTIRGTLDPAGLDVSQSVLDETYAACRAAYRSHKADKQLT